MLGFNFFMIAKWYWRFRTTGGIKGLNPTTNLPEERLAKGAVAIAKKAGNAAEKKLDDVAAKEA